MQKGMSMYVGNYVGIFQCVLRINITTDHQEKNAYPQKPSSIHKNKFAMTTPLPSSNEQEDERKKIQSEIHVPLLQTTTELYATLTEVFVRKPLPYAHIGMIYDTPMSAKYTPYVKLLKSNGRRINITADGNCLFRSLSKGLLGTENFHYHVRSAILGFIYQNSTIFLPHIEQKYKCKVEIKQYCLSMDTSGVWGTEIELLAAATLLQAPVYTYTQMSNSKLYQWSRFPPLSQPSQVICDYAPSIRRLVHMAKPLNYHLELFHFDRCHYDVIVPAEPDKTLGYPTLSDFTCNIDLD